MSEAKTHFASAERFVRDEIQEEYKKELFIEHVKEILNSFPDIVAKKCVLANLL